MTTTCEAIVLVFELRLCSLGSLKDYERCGVMGDVSRSYVTELGETNDEKRLKDNLLRLPFTSSLDFVMRMFASFVKLL